MNTTRQRSRKGCVTCRQKRKKCDELKPQCTRCVQSKDRCTWPEPSASSRAAPNRSGSDSSIRNSPQEERVQGGTWTDSLHNPYQDDLTNLGGNDSSFDVFMDSLPPTEVGDTSLFPQPTRSTLATGSFPAPIFGSGSIPPSQVSTSHYNSYLQLLPRHPRSLIPSSESLSVGRWKHVSAKSYAHHNLDEDEDDEEFESREWLPEARRSLNTLLKDANHSYLLELFDTYILFMSRYCFDPSRAFGSLSSAIFQRYLTSDSIKYAMLGTAALIRGHYDPKAPSALMFTKASDLAATANKLSRLEMQRPDIPLETKLGILNELMAYYYYSGGWQEYYNYLQMAAPIASLILGSNIDFQKLDGEDTFDIRFFAWCDILAAVALCRPTMLTYVCDVDPLIPENLKGQDKDITDAGLGWIVGCPDAFTMLMVQIINLRQNRVPQPERMARAARIEEIARAWIIRPARTSSPLLRVERMAAQEIWRHTIILYLYHAIHKATPANEVVQKSVKQIIDLASTLRSGRNPDCLLPVPYFISATFATTPKDRHFLRTRLAGIGTEASLDNLVATLDDLWNEVGDTGKRVDWSKKQPAVLMF